MRYRRRTIEQGARNRERESSEVRRQPDDWKLDRSGEPFTDAELADLALAADPDAGVAADAVPIDEFLTAEHAGDADDRLPSWYMPPIARRSLYGWRRRVVLLIVISFVVTAAYGVCSAYGFFGL